MDVLKCVFKINTKVNPVHMNLSEEVVDLCVCVNQLIIGMVNIPVNSLYNAHVQYMG